MRKELADETIVVIKRIADEGMVTYPRIKLTERTKDSKGEGWNMLTWAEVYEERSSRDKLIQSGHRSCEPYTSQLGEYAIEEKVIQKCKAT